jgi:cell division protein FtsB
MPWLRLAVVVGLLTFSTVTLATNVIPKRDDLRDTQRMLDEQQRENEATEERIEELRDDADALLRDPWYLSRVLREELNRTDEGEIRIR